MTVQYKYNTPVQKIHFIHRVDERNVGDLRCCPLEYYFDYFKQYNIIKHDLEHIKWGEITPYDIVIFGGGGLLWSDSAREIVNNLLDKSPNVIGWAIGRNTHNGESENVQVDSAKFRLLAMRDYGNVNTRWLPCVSCKGLYAPLQTVTKRRVGIIEHFDIPISKEYSYERISNSVTFQAAVDFINSSEIIVTNSYHMVYWATLLGKKVVCMNLSSNRFEGFKYKPVFFSGDLEADIKRAVRYEGAMEEAVKLNDEFFAEVAEIISKVIIKKGNDYQKVFEMNSRVFSDLHLVILNNKAKAPFRNLLRSFLDFLGVLKFVKKLERKKN